MTNRIDDLLDLYLESGSLPADVTDEERREVLALAAAAERAGAVLPNLAHEVRVTMPTARARFERFVAANPPAVNAPASRQSPAARKQSWWERFGGVQRAFAAGGVAAAIGIVAIIATFTVQNLSSSTGTAVAAVLTPGDYTQVEGTVASVSGEGDSLQMTVDSLLGQISVAVPAGTAVLTSDGQPGEIATLRPGAAVLIAGLVNADRTIAVQTVALGALEREALRPATVRELVADPPPIVEGVVRLITVGEGEALGKLVIVTHNSRFAVPIDGRTAARLLAADVPVVGSLVRATRSESGRLYSVQLGGNVTPPEPGDPAASFVRISGVMTARTANVLTLRTDRGLVPVIVRAQTRILLGESGLTLADVAAGETVIGHTLTVQGSIVPGTRRVIADVIVVGPRAER